MATVTRIVKGIATFVAALFGRWFKAIGNAKGCLGKALILGGGILVIACLCFSGLVAITATGQAVGLIPTLTPEPTTTSTHIVPTATTRPSETPAPVTSTPRPTATGQASATSISTTTAAAPALPSATAATVVEPTQAPLQPVDTATAEPSAPTATAAAPVGARLVIVGVNKEDEYVDIQNQGDLSQDLTGWTLRSERGPQDCRLSGVIEPGATLRIYSMTGAGGFSCNFGDNIWRNDEPDPAVLIDPNGAEVSRLTR